jgi:hypothetical protein
LIEFLGINVETVNIKAGKSCSVCSTKKKTVIKHRVTSVIQNRSREFLRYVTGVSKDKYQEGLAIVGDGAIGMWAAEDFHEGLVMIGGMLLFGGED